MNKTGPSEKTATASPDTWPDTAPRRTSSALARRGAQPAVSGAAGWSPRLAEPPSTASEITGLTFF